MHHHPVSALFTDQYQLTMMYAHWKNGSLWDRCAFDLYFRTLPFKNGFAVMAGLERAMAYLQNLCFTNEDIDYLRQVNPTLDPDFFDILRSFRFQGDLYAIKEGSLIFPNEPLLCLEGNIMELQLIETALLNFIGYQTLIATKAARIRQAAGKDTLMEFGTRRAQEMDAALWGARAAYIGGFDFTSNVLASQRFGVPACGTHAHSWVQSFSNELEAFRSYTSAFLNQSILLVDTYDSLESGLPHAIQIGQELKKQGYTLKGIRLDSGDLARLSKQARQMLDAAGLFETAIVASGDLDEHSILELKQQKSPITSWGVGGSLITAQGSPTLGAVYKMVCRMNEGKWIPTLKVSSHPAKISTPGRKRVYRIVQGNQAQQDLVMGVEEKEPTNAIPLLQPIFLKGERIYTPPSLEEVRAHHRRELACFKKEYLDILHPLVYPVTLSAPLQELKKQMLQMVGAPC